MKHRLERVNELLKRELGSVILRELKFSSPLVTICAVDVTSDLKNAHVYLSALGTPEQQHAALETLEENRKWLQGEVSKRVILKYTPHFHFHLDESVARGTRVMTIMDELGLLEQESAERGKEESEDVSDD